MAAISQKIFSLIGGVSQQPDTIKTTSQLVVCDNYYPDVAFGLTKRPGLQGISKLTGAVNDGTWFSIFRDDNEKYIGQFSPAGVLKIWSANNGVAQTVNAVAAEAITYATHTSSDTLKTLQINDFIFVLNSEISVEAGTTVSASQTPYAFVTVGTVAYASTYTVIIDGNSFAYATPTSATTQLNIKNIIDNLVSSINANPSYVAQGIANNIYVRRANNADFAIEAKGGNAGTSIEAFKGTITSTAQLPKQFVNDLKVKVLGAEDGNADDYWVIFKTSNNTSTGAGVWEETVCPDIITDFNEETMPHVIIREADGSFTYRQLDEASATVNIGTYVRTSPSTTLTVTLTSHGLTNGTTVYLEFTTGTALSGAYTVAGATANTFTITTAATTTVSGKVRLVRGVTGIPTAVTITSATTGGHTVNEQFEPTGGSGKNLRLQVTKTKTVTVNNTYSSSSNSYIYQVNSSTWHWFFNGSQIGITASNTSLVIGNTTFTVNGVFTTISSQLRAGYISSQVTTGVIDSVIIQQSGQGYAASNVVKNAAQDTFTITTVATQFPLGDASSLNFWKLRDVGDVDTNPMPTFVGSPIDLITFFKNRLVFASRQNVICSQAGDYFNFFASTVITIVDSDPIDLSASSLKPIRLRQGIAAPSGLLLFGDNAQFILETRTEAFSSRTAEINVLGDFSQTDRIAPLDLGSSYLFLEEGQKSSALYEMNLKDSIGNKPDIFEQTRNIPTYIPSAVKAMQVSQSAGTIAILSNQEPSNLYLWRWFNVGDTRVSGWFRWTLPGTIQFFAFDHDILFVVTKHDTNYVLNRMSLITDTPSQSLLFENQYLDVRLDIFDYYPTVAYDAASNLTRVSFKEGFEDLIEQAVIVYLDPTDAGYFEEQTIQYDASKPAGEQYYLTVPGNASSSKYALGYKYEALAQLPAFYVVKDETRGLKDTLNIPRINRIKVNSYNSGPYKAVIRTEGRDDFTLTLPQIVASNYNANTIPIVRNAQSTIPILAKGDQFEFELIADSPFPTAFTSIDWEGTYDAKGIKAV